MTKPKKGPDNAELTRTRARQVDGIVAGIVHDMAEGRWVAGKSHRALMQEHGVDVKTVRGWAAQAGRLHRILRSMDREELAAEAEARLDNVYAMALDKTVVVYTGHGEDREAEVVPQPDLKAAVAAVAEKSKLLGLNAPEKHQHAHVVATYEASPPGDRLTQVREAIAALQAEEAAIVAGMLPEGE